MNLPNSITLGRIFCVPVLIWMLSPHFPHGGWHGEQEVVASLFFILLSISDGIDGYLARAEQIKCPLLFHFGEQDRLIPAAAVKAVSKAFAAKADAWVQTYPGVDHGFNCWARAAYNQAAAALARGRTLEFLSIYL